MIVALLGFQSCSKDDDDDNKPKSKLKGGEIEINSSAWGKWIYVSLESGKKVGESKAEEKRDGLDWDMAFCRSDVRLNCGTSGTGKAGVIVADGKFKKSGWEAVTEAPKDGYAVDEIYDKFMVSMQPYKEAQVSTATTMKNKWVIMKTMGNYTILDQIFIIKTANGKYGKIWFKQYVNSEGKGGHITLKYAYQDDGTRDLK